jgi:hypothetical protein
MRSEAATIGEYLDSLPEDRRAALETVREVILSNLPDGYEEVMNWGMITYQVPLSTFGDTYNDQPLMYAALASQKHHMAVYLTAVYASEPAAEEFRAAYRATGKRLDMGKSCVRFRRLEDLPLELIGETISSTGVERFIELAGRRKRAAE